MARARYNQALWQAQSDGTIKVIAGAPFEIRQRNSATLMTLYTADTGGTTFTGAASNLAVRSGRVEPAATPGGEIWMDEGSPYDEYTTQNGLPGFPLIKVGAGVLGGAGGGSGGAPTGSAGGVLAGTYPNPTFAASMATTADLTAGLATKQDAATAATDAELSAHAALSEGVHGLPNAPALSGIRRNSADTAWEAIDIATQAELDAHEADTSNVHGITDTANIMQRTIVDAKGDLIAASGADAVVRVPVGTNDFELVADSTQSSGLAWSSPVITGTGVPSSLRVGQRYYQLDGSGNIIGEYVGMP